MAKSLGILLLVGFGPIGALVSSTDNHVRRSTIVVLFEKGTVQWDEDLLINGWASLETLVRVGMGIGNGTRSTN